MSKIIISWKTPEYFPRERNSDWFWAVGIIAAAIIFTSILLNNLILAIFFVIATLTIFIYAKRQPEIITIEIGDDGVRAGKNMYPYGAIKAFWIKGGEFSPMLLLKSGSILNPLIVIPLAKANPEQIREALNPYLTEEEIEEPGDDETGPGQSGR